MAVSVGWFVLQAAVALFVLWLGVRVGRQPTTSLWLWLALALVLIVTWGWLKHNPSVAVYLIDPGAFAYLEGTGGVPGFMFVIGAVYGSSCSRHQRRAAVLAALFGGLYFLQGGMWMLQTTPSSTLASTIGSAAVLQSQEFSCVPASCATALRIVGMTATEAEMAELTQTRPGTGSTLIRALDALRHRLARSPIRVQLLEPTFPQLAVLPMPALTPLQFKPGQLHMVVILSVDEHGVQIVDPQIGRIRMDRSEFEQVFTRQVIVFERSR